MPSRLRRHALDTRPLKIPAYRRQLMGQGTAYIGSMLTAVAVPVQIFDITGSSLQVGYVGLAGLLPIIAFGLYGGAIADAIDRRVLYLISSLGTWLVTLGLLTLTLLHAHSAPLILLMVVFQASFFAISTAARGAIIPRIVASDLVAAANTLCFTVTNLGQILGPAIAGLLVTRSNGFAYAYSTDAVLFTMALYAAMRLPPLPPDGAAKRAGLRSVIEGLSFVKTQPVLLMSFVVDIVAMVFAMPRALFPQVAAERWHGQVGLLYAAIAAGSVVAGLGSGWIGRVRRQGAALTLACVAWGLAITAAGFASQLWLVVCLLALAGAADLVSAVYRLTIVQTCVPDALRGRMQGVLVVAAAGGPRLGDLRAGATAAATSPAVSWVGGGIVCTVVVLAVGRAVRPFWRYLTAVTETAPVDRREDALEETAP